MYSNRIKFYRKQLGFTQDKLSQLTGLSIGYICHLEKGTRKNPSVETMTKISNVLHRTIGETFFDGGFGD